MTTAIIDRLYNKITGTWRSDINVIELGGTWVWLQRFNCEEKLFGFLSFLAPSNFKNIGIWSYNGLVDSLDKSRDDVVHKYFSPYGTTGEMFHI